jgi:hypothetical protein
MSLMNYVSEWCEDKIRDFRFIVGIIGGSDLEQKGEVRFMRGLTRMRLNQMANVHQIFRATLARDFSSLFLDIMIILID